MLYYILFIIFRLSNSVDLCTTIDQDIQNIKNTLSEVTKTYDITLYNNNIAIQIDRELDNQINTFVQCIEHCKCTIHNIYYNNNNNECIANMNNYHIYDILLNKDISCNSDDIILNANNEIECENNIKNFIREQNICNLSEIR